MFIYVKKMIDTPQGEKEIYEKNKERQWTGGWLNPTFRHRTRVLYSSLKKAFPNGFKAETNLLLININANEIFVSGNPDFISKKLNIQSVTESMLKVFIGPMDLKVKFFMKKCDMADKIKIEYYIEESSLRDYLIKNKKNCLILFLHPYECYLLASIDLKNIEIEKVIKFIDQNYVKTTIPVSLR